jgi:uncharacterized protein YacL
MSWEMTGVRIIFLLVIIVASFQLHPFGLSKPLAALLGAALGVFFILFEMRLERASLKRLFGAAAGSILGILGALMISHLLSLTALDKVTLSFLQVTLLLLMTYVGLVLGANKGDLLNLSALGGLFSAEVKPKRNFKILDTSVIIQIQIVEEDFPQVREVDMKLIELAKQLEGKIVTNDFNLNKMAQLQGVAVLNVNELANALKPVVLPGEIMRVFILKEGKEYNQGVAYLDDGTMVVVDNAKKMISKTIDIAVTSVLQTTAGKMIFGKFEERKAVAEPVHQ